jgi:hypothetical protein
MILFFDYSTDSYIKSGKKAFLIEIYSYIEKYIEKLSAKTVKNCSKLN